MNRCAISIRLRRFLIPAATPTTRRRRGREGVLRNAGVGDGSVVVVVVVVVVVGGGRDVAGGCDDEIYTGEMNRRRTRRLFFGGCLTLISIE